MVSAIEHWALVYQSRSGPPSQPWLEPDIGDHLRGLKQEGVQDVIVAPIGFISDHLEVMYDLDVEAKELSEEIGLHLVRAATVGTHPAFVSMIVDLIVERSSADPQRHGAGVRWVRAMMSARLIAVCLAYPLVLLTSCSAHKSRCRC